MDNRIRVNSLRDSEIGSEVKVIKPDGTIYYQSPTYWDDVRNLKQTKLRNSAKRFTK